VRIALERTSARREPEDKHFSNHVLITVDDDGPGIPPHALERIFERFYTDRPSQGFGQNSGLGLSISRQIVEAHGGRIWACNRPSELVSAHVPSPESEDSDEPTRHGAGARFVVELPAFSA
jgi:two-component system, OmpR family, sensor histidine kinase ChvG